MRQGVILCVTMYRWGDKVWYYDSVPVRWQVWYYVTIYRWGDRCDNMWQCTVEVTGVILCDDVQVRWQGVILCVTMYRWGDSCDIMWRCTGEVTRCDIVCDDVQGRWQGVILCDNVQVRWQGVILCLTMYTTGEVTMCRWGDKVWYCVTMYRWGEDVVGAAAARCSTSPWQLDHPSWPQGIQPSTQPQGHPQGSWNVLHNDVLILLLILLRRFTLH